MNSACKQTRNYTAICSFERKTNSASEESGGNGNAPELLQGGGGKLLCYFVYTGSFFLGGQGMMGNGRPEQVENNLKTIINIQVYSQAQRYFIIELIGNKFRSLDHHQAIII